MPTHPFHRKGATDSRWTSPRRLAAATAIVLAGAAGVGCSDDDGDAGPTTTAEAPSSEGEGNGTAGDQAAIDIIDIAQAYDPSSVTVTAGSEVTWTNADSMAHTATSEDGTWDSGSIGPDEEFSFTADEPGTYTYVCSFHPSMTGELIVE